MIQDKKLLSSDKYKEKADFLIRQFDHLVGDRGTLESHWVEIADRVIPAQSRNFFTRQTLTKGEKRTELQYDSTAASALKRFAAILDSLLTPRNQTWHRVVPSHKELLKDRMTRLYFDEVNRILFRHRYAPTANFSAQNQQNYLSLGAFGTGCMFIDDLQGGEGLRYKAIHLGEVYFTENHQGIADQAFRKFRMTARQAVQKFGEDVMPDQIISALKVNGEREFDFLHVVRPREDYDPVRIDHKGMKWESCYVSMEGRKPLSEGGFTTFPYAISRYEQAMNEVYGRSPAMEVLPAIKTLNEEKKTMLKQGHRAVDPVLLAHDDGILDGFSLKPGAINAGGVTAEGRPLVHALPVGQIAIGKELMDDERNVINDAFLVSLFQILVETPQMTATEVMERTREKGILLAPTVGRQQSEYLGPLIDRELDILNRQGLLPPMPPALREAQGDYRVEYDSPLSRSQRAEEASGLMRTVESVLQIVNVTQNPEPLDLFDWDVIIPDLSEINAVPGRWMRDMNVVMQMRQGRAQQAQAQTAIQAAPAAASLIKSNAVAQQVQQNKR